MQNGLDGMWLQDIGKTFDLIVFNFPKLARTAYNTTKLARIA